MSDVKTRFIRTVLQEEGSKMIERQGEAIASRTRRHTGRLESARRISISGSDGSMDGTLSFAHTAYERFLDMKRVSGRSSGSRKIHNRFVMQAFGKIAYRLMNELSDEMRRAIKSEIGSVTA